MDYINGDPDIRLWIEKNGTSPELQEMEDAAVTEFAKLRQAYLCY